jgi:hypothetical protein
MIYECTIKEKPEGFGLYQRGEERPCDNGWGDNITTYKAWEEIASDEGAVTVERVPKGELPWGCVEGGDYGRIYRLNDGTATWYQGVRIGRAHG